MNASPNNAGLICFRVDLSLYAMVPNFAPGGNYIGSLLLKKCVEMMFERAGLEYGGPGCFPQALNKCTGVWRVNDVQKGVAVLEAVLDDLQLLQERFTDIGYFDERESFWRNSYPGNSLGDLSRRIGLNLEVFAADMSKRQAEFSDALRKVMEALKG